VETSAATDPVETLRRLTRTAADPRVRRRAHAVVLVVEGKAVLKMARLFETAPHRVRAWRSRFRVHGGVGMVN
jgi:transposase-like protein